MARVTEKDVRDLLDGDIGDTTSLPSLAPFVEIGSSITDDLYALAVTKGLQSKLTDAKLKIIERWLSAHYAVHRSPQYKSKATQAASGTFDILNYQKAAIEADPTGLLESMLTRVKASGAWLGKPYNQQTTYRSRNY